MIKKYGFPYSSRLHSPNEFRAVFSEPTKSSSAHIKVLVRLNDKETARLGVIVAKRELNRAVDRNRVRRWIRECFRLHQHELHHLDVIVIARRSVKDFHEFAAFCKHLRQRWKDVIQKAGVT